MIRVLLTIFLIFAVPLGIAYLLQHIKNERKRRDDLRRKWREKLREKEKKLGRRFSVEEIKQWLVLEWFKDRIEAAEDFAHEIKYDLIERR